MLRDQVRQYVAKAIGAYGTDAQPALSDLRDMAINPDFFLPEFNVYIEYWGMDTADYKIGLLKKQQFYQQQGKKLISLYPDDKPRIRELINAKLRKFQ